MVLLRNLCVNFQDFLCGVFQYASAQSLDFLNLAQNRSFMNMKTELASSGVSVRTLANRRGVRVLRDDNHFAPKRKSRYLINSSFDNQFRDPDESIIHDSVSQIR